MPFPTLRVSDFDLTLTIQHTFKFSCFYTAANNTKQGLDQIAKHDNQNIFAIATHHDNVDYVLSYVLPLLNLTSEAIQKKEEHPYPSHKITAYYFNNVHYPLLISTVENNAQRKLGKKIALNDLLHHLPECNERHFYDDDPDNVRDACDLPDYRVHQVSRKATFEIDHKGTLISFLKYCKKTRERDVREFNGWGSYFSFNFFGYSRTAEIKAADALIKSLESKTPLDPAHLQVLSQGRLATFIHKWELQYGMRWSELVPINPAESACYSPWYSVAE